MYESTTMAYSEYLADRIRNVLDHKSVIYEEKKMMGGLTFMVNNKMCVGIVKEDLMSRVGPKVYQEALEMDGAREMDFTGRPMKGYVFISSDGVDTDDQLENWVSMALEFNKELVQG